MEWSGVEWSGVEWSGVNRSGVMYSLKNKLNSALDLTQTIYSKL